MPEGIEPSTSRLTDDMMSGESGPARGQYIYLVYIETDHAAPVVPSSPALCEGKEHSPRARSQACVLYHPGTIRTAYVQ